MTKMTIDYATGSAGDGGYDGEEAAVELWPQPKTVDSADTH